MYRVNLQVHTMLCICNRNRYGSLALCLAFSTLKSLKAIYSGERANKCVIAVHSKHLGYIRAR